MSNFANKTLKAIGLSVTGQGHLVSSKSHAVRSESHRKSHIMRPEQNQNGIAVDGQTFEWKINPGTIKDKIKDVQLLASMTVVGGTSYVFGGHLMIESVTLSVGGTTTTPIYHGTGEELLFMATTVNDFDTRRKCKVPWNWTTQDNYLNTAVTAGSSITYAFRLDNLSYLMSQIPMNLIKNQIIVSIKFVPASLLGTATGVTPVPTFVAADSVLLQLNYDQDLKAREQEYEALLKKDLSICYTSVVTQDIPVTNATDTIFQVNMLSNSGRTFLVTFTLLSKASGLLYRDPQLIFISNSRVSDRVDFKDASGASLIGGPLHPLVLAMDERIPSTTGVLTWPTIGAGSTNTHRYVTLPFSESIVESLEGHVNGYISGGPFSIHFEGAVDVVAGNNIGRFQLFQHREVHFNAHSGEFKVIIQFVYFPIFMID